MNLSATRIRLEMLSRELLRNWGTTKSVWRDAKGQEFEAEYLQELAVRVSKASSAMEKLDQLLTKVRNDCE